jgi:APA family basic amino acid/polyamine antiporter
MVVIGGMVGSGIFMSPYVVARIVRTPLSILSVWVLGGAIALAGAAAYSELAARRPHVGGQYVYLRDAYHPSIAFLYGWGLLVISQSGGMAAVAVTCARYVAEGLQTQAPQRLIAVAALAAVTLVNCFGVRTWKLAQNGLTILKIALVVALVLCALVVTKAPAAAAAPSPPTAGVGESLIGMGSALVPVMFAYGGWQTLCYLGGEVREPRQTLPRALFLGVSSVTILYLAVNYVTLRVLGPGVLATTTAPAAAVMQIAVGQRGARLVSFGVAIAAIGFLNQCMLTVPRVYYAMADDRLFFRWVARLHPRTGTPVMAITLQGAVAGAIALFGAYEQILTWIVAVDYVFYALGASCLFAFRYRDGTSGLTGRPFTTVFTTVAFVAACAFVVVTSLVHSPGDSALGIAMVLTGVPAYMFWSRHR